MLQPAKWAGGSMGGNEWAGPSQGVLSPETMEIQGPPLLGKQGPPAEASALQGEEREVPRPG